MEEIAEYLKFKVFSNRVDADANDFGFTNADESFFAELLNLTFNYSLSKTEKIKRNYPAIDLVDNHNKIIVQVTYSIDHEKLEKSMNHDVIKQYNGYKYIYFYTGAADISSFKMSQRKLVNSHNLNFTRNKNILAIEDILFALSNLTNTQRLKQIRDLFPEVQFLETHKISSQLAKVINILKSIKRTFEASANFEEEIMTYEIQQKIDYNNLVHYEDIVSKYASYCALLQDDDGLYKISYEEVNVTPREIYNKIKTYYTEAMINNNHDNKIPRNGDKIFISVFEAIKNDVRRSKEYDELEEELLDDCLYIILVDAFVACKWFVKPPKEIN